MKTNTHTPGPWFPVRDSAHAWEVKDDSHLHGQIIARVGGDNPYMGGSAEGNAKLIAAAPEMLEFCINVARTSSSTRLRRLANDLIRKTQ